MAEIMWHPFPVHGYDQGNWGAKPWRMLYQRLLGIFGTMFGPRIKDGKQSKTVPDEDVVFRRMRLLRFLDATRCLPQSKERCIISLDHCYQPVVFVRIESLTLRQSQRERQQTDRLVAQYQDAQTIFEACCS